jgi:hypothetical protein
MEKKRPVPAGKTQSTTVETIPAFPNWFPYNDLLLDGKLIAKSRSWSWRHRGLTLLYTSSRIARPVAQAHGMDPKDYPRRAIIGVGRLVDVRLLTRREWHVLRRQFNNVPLGGMRKIIAAGEFVEPLPYGFFFRDLQRFADPVPFAWPTGPVKPINVPTALVARELRKLDIRV